MELNVSLAAKLRVLVFFAVVLALVCKTAESLRREVVPATADLRFSALFNNVAGLKPGSPVRLAGVDAGRVTDLAFTRAKEGRDLISVSIAVRSDYAKLVRKGAIVTIDSLGVLGDKYVEIGLAEPNLASLAAGEVVTGTDPISLGDTMKKMDAAVDDLRVVAGFWRKVIEKTEGIKEMWEKFKQGFSN
ncbi:MAG: MCE family protein [Candidatus Wallbacteria bacterium]|nr:MCE family protein [Candidatus Wallbacteria bacterium]